jgi:hypothetical protein
MPKYTGWVIKKQYFKVELEATCWEEAKDNILFVDVDHDKPDDIDWDIYDITEVQQ